MDTMRGRNCRLRRWWKLLPIHDVAHSAGTQQFQRRTIRVTERTQFNQAVWDAVGIDDMDVVKIAVHGQIRHAIDQIRYLL